MTDFLTEFHCF